MSAAKHTPDDLRQFAQEHAPKLAEKITKLCGSVIALGIQGILEEVCRIQSERDELLEALQQIAMASSASVCNPEWITARARAAISKATGITS